MKYKIPVYQPSIGLKEKQYVNDCLDSSWISSKGKYIEAFEKSFSEKTNVKYATSVCNGTVALHVALLSIGIGKDDEVIVPTFTYIASVNAIQYTGATPVFVDSDLNTWQIDPQDVEDKITNKTKAIIAVHLYGQSCNMEQLKKIAEKHKIFLVEDCAEAFGTTFKGQHVGSFGDISTYSFFGNKTITTGEGGMVVTNNETLYERSKHLKEQGLAKYRQYWHDVVGYNYRLSNIACAIGLAQLERSDQILKRKREIAEFYKKAFDKTDYIFHNEADGTYHSYWMCSILINQNKFHKEAREKLRNYLDSKGIETRPLFYPVHTMPMYYAQYQTHKNAENISRRGINLPSYPDLKDSDLKYVCDSVLECVL